MEFREYLRILLTHKRMILLLALVTCAVATAGGIRKKPIYRAHTTVVIKSALMEQRAISSSVGLGEGADVRMRGETYGQILGSRAVAEKIVDALGLDKLGKAPPPPSGALKAKLSALKDFLKYGGPIQKQPARLSLIEGIQGAISTAIIPNTFLIEISVKYGDPKVAAEIANSAAQVFVEHMREMNAAEAKTAREFISTRVQVADEDMEASQEALKKFIVGEGTIYTEQRVNLALAEMFGLHSSLRDTTLELEQLKVHVQELRGKLAKFNKQITAATASAGSPVVQELQKRLVDFQIQRVTLSVDYGPLHPRMQAIEQEIAKMQEALDSEVRKLAEGEASSVNPVYDQLVSELISKETALSTTQQRKTALEELVRRYPADVNMSAEKKIDWDMLESAVKFAQKNVDSLKTQLETARITEAQKLSEIGVVDAAIPIPVPTGLPKVAYPLLGLIVGLMAGVGLAFFLEHLDDSIKTIETVEEELKLSVYAVIPQIRFQGKKVRKRRGGARETADATDIRMLEERLLTHFEPQSPIAEAYRSFRTNIQFAGIRDKTKIFLISSSLKGEGKTTTSANLGITLAHLGNRALLIDADMRNPMVHAIFGRDKEPGLSNFIGGGMSLDQVVVPSGIPNLDLICSGPIPPNPSELLSSRRVPDLIAAVRDRYDLVIFDTPPIIAVTDAAVLSPHVHGVFLVIKAGQTSKRICMRAKTLFEKVNANLLGAVMNNIKADSSYGYEYYYHYYGETSGKKAGS